jgi:hypothetical protein
MKNWLFKTSDFTSLVAGVPLGLMYAWNAHKQLQEFFEALHEHTRGLSQLQSQLKGLLLRQLVTRLVVFMLTAVICVLVLSVDVFMFGVGVIFAQITYVMIRELWIFTL